VHLIKSSTKHVKIKGLIWKAIYKKIFSSTFSKLSEEVIVPNEFDELLLKAFCGFSLLHQSMLKQKTASEEMRQTKVNHFSS